MEQKAIIDKKAFAQEAWSSVCMGCACVCVCVVWCVRVCVVWCSSGAVCACGGMGRGRCVRGCPGRKHGEAERT